MLRSCPFCNGDNLGYSIKVASRKRDSATYHVCIYCKDCNCYGSRVLVHKNTAARKAIETDEQARKEAELVWNTRLY